MESVGQRRSGSFAALGQRSFRYLFFSPLALSYSQWFQQIGLGWLVLQITGSAAQLGGVTFVQGVMVFLASLPGGVMADRYNRRTILVWTTALNVVQALGLALLVFSGQMQPWHLYVFGFIGGVVHGIAHPVRQPLVYDLTSPVLLTNAVTMSSMSWSLARVSGPPVAGMLLGFFDTSSTFFIAAILIAVAMVMTLQIPAGELLPSGTTKDESPVSSVMGGLKYALTDPIILPLLLAFSIARFWCIPTFRSWPSSLETCFMAVRSFTGFWRRASAGAASSGWAP